MVVEMECVLDAQAVLGEGPVWDVEKQVLYWVDIERGEVHVFDPERLEDRSIGLGLKVGAVVPARSGELVVATQEGFGVLDPRKGRLTQIADPEGDNPDSRFNDGKADPVGRFWAGTMSMSGRKGAGALYCLDTDASVDRKLEGLSISNGLAWSLDEDVLYFIDSPTRQVVAYDYDADSGEISNERAVVEVPAEEGTPDGMTIDAEGKLWVAMWDGAQVCRFDPSSGRMIEAISVPATRVTSCTFGGPDLETLYITTARRGLSERQLKKEPLAGGIFRCRPGVSGVEAYYFEG